MNFYDNTASLNLIDKEVASETNSNRFFPLKFNNRYYDFQDRTAIMGILNITPDSFYDGGKYDDIDKALKKIEEMIEAGADFIDIGAESTRPGSKTVSEDEELRRIIPVVEKAIKNFDTIFSVDTSKSVVAKEVLTRGVMIINDISGLKFDQTLANHVADHDAAIVLMHTPSRPDTMQNNTTYNFLLDDILFSIKNSISIAIERGIHIENIIVDPGIGFGKDTQQNLEIINNLKHFLSLTRPVLIGTSRKSFIGNVLENLPVDKRLEGTAASISVSIINGASIIRVHDVYEMRLVAQMTDAIINS